MNDKNRDKAAEIWATFNDSEKFGARFAMFPADKMKPENDPGFTDDDRHEITCALMRMSKEMP